MGRDKIDAVVHLAARKSVSESINNPGIYAKNNEATSNLLKAMEITKINSLIFSSTAAVYGGQSEVVTEESEIDPESPYATSKVLDEKLILQASQSWGLRGLVLRFFNVVGAAENQLVEVDGENILPKIIQSSLDDVVFTINGFDYETPDGTCIRDYIDVRDVVSAVMLGLAVVKNSEFEVLNIGTETGTSVLQIVEGSKKYIAFEYQMGPRRMGDSPKLITSIARAKVLLCWEPKWSLQDSLKSVLKPH